MRMHALPVNMMVEFSNVTRPVSKWKIAAGLGVACAACCAPLLLPLVAGAGGAGLAGATASGFLGASWGEIACIAVLAALVAGAAVLVLRAGARRKRAAECACGSARSDGASCAVGGECDPSVR
ncbi:MAG: hypothetical protein B7Y90_14340 [Alphaproteobacteria bacterium 32-64-14]|nr:MAG: hypothetical protein B7Y90_14340 [Alphaproteobacteria bacterium 32-64-14]